MSQSYCGCPVDAYGCIAGELPPELMSLQAAREDLYSDMIEELGHEVRCIRGEEEDGLTDDAGDVIEAAFRAWAPPPPAGGGWKLAWKALDEEGPNVVFWRPRAAVAAMSRN